MSLLNLTQGQINKIQIDEGIVVVDYGETSEKVLGPTRGGAEFTATPSIRDIEYDGRKGKTAGMQVKDGEDVALKIAVLDCSQETLALAIPSSVVTNGKIEQSDFGVIPTTAYLKNVAVITKMLDGTYKILTVKKPMHEGPFTFKTASKSENEHSLEFLGHYNALDIDEKMWSVEDSATNPLTPISA